VNDFKAQLTHSFYASFAYYPDKKQEVARGAERHDVSSLESGAIFIPLSFFNLFISASTTWRVWISLFTCFGNGRLRGEWLLQ